MNAMKTKVKFICTILIMSIALSAIGQTISVVTPEKCGLSSDSLRKINHILNDYANRKEVAGGVALIARKGQIAYLKSFGMKDIETQQPTINDVIFRIASMTKAITVTAVMVLFEEGHFTLEDSISKFIPEFSEMQVMVLDTSTNTYTLEKAKRQITIRHLLTHTSGLTYDFFGQKGISEMYIKNDIFNGIGTSYGTLEDMVKRVAKLPLINQPGEKWQYGVNMEVLGYLIEKLSGQPLDKFLSERIFTPLNMVDTHFYLPQEKTKRLATLYGPNSSGQIEKTIGKVKVGNISYSDYETYASSKTYFAAGGGLLSTANDYYNILQMLLNKGEYNNKRLLSRKTVELITSEQTGNKFSWFLGHGFGFGCAISRGPEITGQAGSKGAYTWAGAFNTHYWVDPKEELIIILMTQLYPRNSNIDVEFKKMAYQSIIN